SSPTVTNLNGISSAFATKHSVPMVPSANLSPAKWLKASGQKLEPLTPSLSPALPARPAAHPKNQQAPSLSVLPRLKKPRSSKCLTNTIARLSNSSPHNRPWTSYAGTCCDRRKTAFPWKRMPLLRSDHGRPGFHRSTHRHLFRDAEGHSLRHRDLH